MITDEELDAAFRGNASGAAAAWPDSGGGGRATPARGARAHCSTSAVAVPAPGLGLALEGFRAAWTTEDVPTNRSGPRGSKGQRAPGRDRL